MRGPNAVGGDEPRVSVGRLLATAMATVAAVATVVLLVGCSPNPAGSAPVAVVGPTVSLPLLPEFSSSAGNSIWYSDAQTGKVARLDVTTGTAGNAIVINDPAADSPYGSPKAIAADPTGAWVADASHMSIDRVDRATNRVTRRIALTYGVGDKRVTLTPFGITTSGDTAWVTDFDKNLVAEVDTRTGQVTRVLDGVANPAGLTLSFGSLWIVQHRRGSIARISLTTWSVSAVISLPGTGPNPICGMCVDKIIAGPSALWVPLDFGKAVARIDPAANRVTADTPIGLEVDNLAVDATSVWLAGWDGSIPCTDTHAVVERLDPVSGSPRGRVVISCAFNPTLASPSGDLWVGIADNPNGARLLKPRI